MKYITLWRATLGLFFLSVSCRRELARDSVDDLAFMSIYAAILSFNEKYERVPTTEEGLDVLKFRPINWSSARVWEPTIQEISLDSWGSPYEYSSVVVGQDQVITVRSLGVDAKNSSDDVVSKFSVKIKNSGNHPQ